MANSTAVRDPLRLLVPTEGIPEEVLCKVENARRNEVISDSYPYPTKLSRRKYERQKAELQVELLKMQRWVQETGERVVLLFEGRDAAGKGGTIKRFMEHLNPRGATLVALPAPSERERGQWYFQRYVQHLPAMGEIIFFDRSWYNRAVVEPVMGFCTPAETVRFLRDTVLFEEMLINEGLRLYKFWFSVSREEQLRRVMSRARDGPQAVESEWRRRPVAASVGRVHRGEEGDVRGHRYEGLALGRREVGRQEARPNKLHALRAAQLGVRPRGRGARFKDQPEADRAREERIRQGRGLVAPAPTAERFD